MSQQPVYVTAAEISRLAGVTRATVSNWRRRHADFPPPAAGADTSPLYDLDAVRVWLAAHGPTKSGSALAELRTLLRLRQGSAIAHQLLPFVLAAVQAERDLTALPDKALAEAANQAVVSLADLPGSSTLTYETDDAPVLRAIVNSVRDQGGLAVVDVLAERELADSNSPGAFTTPRQLADLMAALLGTDDHYPETVFDPACGGGSLLDAAGSRGATELLGQDRVEVQALRSTLRLTLSRPEALTLVRAGDSLRADAFHGLKADAVLCNPPFGDREWGHDELAYDPRWTYGTPSRGESELAWVQHALAHLAPGGHAVLLLPPSTATRTPSRKIRTELLKAGAIRAVIALPPGLAVPLHVGLHLWVLRNPPSNATAEPILMLDLSEGSGDETPAWETLTGTTLATWRAFLNHPDEFEPVPGRARAVPVVELFGDNVDLTPIRHLHRAQLDPAEVSQQAALLLSELSQSHADLDTAISSQRWSASDQPRTWRTALISDLVRGGLLAVLRPEPATPVIVAAGDVLLPKGVALRERARFRVVDDRHAGAVLDADLVALRVDPSRLDPWFLAGFSLTEENLAAASGLRSYIPIDPLRFKVPLLPLEEQIRYGSAFRELHRLEEAARQIHELAVETARTVSSALTGGGLKPPQR
ncbi:N-6 DNA methylase [Spongiactinospora sp. TRM90649]|uniref:N-6 DNA methylase n=1 Tax=Spongiactinospora sp. TRM90649 TaxID=3031114 RepID=UPI0023F8F616|nr:N-6 DNA methylase [Spongiactinospora sp. TRM90649]MDF5759060.1 N-6 DNA methylase [Spongiactinospora sp. TRM90649]